MKCEECLGTGREIDGEQQRFICNNCLMSGDSSCSDCIPNSCVHCNGTGEVNTGNIKTGSKVKFNDDRRKLVRFVVAKEL